MKERKKERNKERKKSIYIYIYIYKMGGPIMFSPELVNNG